MSDLQKRLRSYADWLVSCALGNIPEEAETAYEAASRISQQDAELERLRRELADMTISRDGYAKQAMAREAEGRRKAFIEAAEIAEEYAKLLHQDGLPHVAAEALAAKFRAKAEETDHDA